MTVLQKMEAVSAQHGQHLRVTPHGIEGAQCCSVFAVCCLLHLA